MKKILAILTIFLLSGCAGFFLPKLPGPATNVECTISRIDGSLTGSYSCKIDGQYELNRVGF